MSSLDQPLELGRPARDTRDYARPGVMQPRAIPVPKPSITKKIEPLEMEDIGQEESLGQEEEPEEPVADVEPIEIKPQEPVSESFQVGTLAELAQMDNKGAPIAMDSHDKAIELEPKPRVASASAAKRIQSAAREVAEKIPGATSDQVSAIQSLTREVIERVVWEVVPELAETIIKEELAKLLKE